MRESKVEKHLTDRVKALGGDTRKLSYVGRHSATDRLLLFPAQSPGHVRVWEFLHTLTQDAAVVTFWAAAQHPLVETKRPKLDANEAQAREHERLRAAGFIVLVLDSIEAIDKVLPL